jgi:hypothetical protein
VPADKVSSSAVAVTPAGIIIDSKSELGKD